MFTLEEADIIAAKHLYAVNPANDVVQTVHPQDTMWYLAHHPIGYAKHGASALAMIKTALQLARVPEPSSILDFGCGHGRVGRWLRAEYFSSVIVGAEIIPDAVSFYSDALGADGWQTVTELSSNTPDRKFDLIWSGSVFTHLPQASSMALYNQFIEWLNPAGIVVFSVHGRISTDLFRRGEVPKTNRQAANDAIQRFDRGEYAFTPYNDQEDYGMSFSPPEWWVGRITDSISTRLVYYAEGAWAGNQDIVAVQKLPAVYKQR